MTVTLSEALATLDIEEVLAHSYKDFHVKGFDYVCLHRSPEFTLKAYFFADGMESQAVGEVVNPHDHRYDFSTFCLSGTIENRWYRFPPCWDGRTISLDECGELYTAFEYDTPLNGGSGFSYAGEVPLQLKQRTQFPAGQGYFMNYDEFHTIRVVERETCIILAQYEDVVPVGEPTTTFVKAPPPPSLDGLYSEFTADEVVARINLLHELGANLTRGSL